VTHVIIIAPKSDALLCACRRADVVPFFATDVRAGAARLRELGARRVRGLCIDVREAEAPELLMDLRDEARFFNFPILALVAPSLGEEQRRAIWLGATDAVVADDEDGIAARLAPMRAFDADVRPGSYRRTALVHHPDWTARRVLGRAARRAGLDPILVDDLEELRATLRLARLPVAALLFRPDDPRVEAELLEHGLPSVLVGSSQRLRPDPPPSDMEPREAPSHEPSLPVAARRPGGRLAVIDHPLLFGDQSVSPRSRAAARTLVVRDDAISEDLGFLLHELTVDPPRRRSSRRLLADAVCAFRAAGTRSPSLAVVHDVSRDGLFARTLAALPEGLDVWVELRPDEASPWIHLRGVVTRRSRVGDATVLPRGFAVRLRRDDCPAPDLGVWDAAYARAAAPGRGRAHLTLVD